MGEKAGTEGLARRMEAFQLRLNKGKYSGGIKYAAHVESIGWQDYVTDGEIAGVEGQGLKVEAFNINLLNVDENAKTYNLAGTTGQESWT